MKLKIILVSFFMMLFLLPSILGKSNKVKIIVRYNQDTSILMWSPCGYYHADDTFVCDRVLFKEAQDSILKTDSLQRDSINAKDFYFKNRHGWINDTIWGNPLNDASTSGHFS